MRGLDLTETFAVHIPYAARPRPSEPATSGGRSLVVALALVLAIGCHSTTRPEHRTPEAAFVDAQVERMRRPNEQSLAAEELANSGSNSIPRMRQLLRTHRDESLSVAQYTAIVHALGLMGRPATAALPELIELWTSDHQLLRQQAASVLLPLVAHLDDESMAELAAAAPPIRSSRLSPAESRYPSTRALGDCWFEDALRLVLAQPITPSAEQLHDLLLSRPRQPDRFFHERSAPLAVAALLARRQPPEGSASQRLRSTLTTLRDRALRLRPPHERAVELYAVAGALQRALHALEPSAENAPFVRDLSSARAMLRDFDPRERRAALSWFRRERPAVSAELRLEVAAALWDSDWLVAREALRTFVAWPELGAVALPGMLMVARRTATTDFEPECSSAIRSVLDASSRRGTHAQRTLCAFEASVAGPPVRLPADRDEEVVHELLVGCRLADFATCDALFASLLSPAEEGDSVFALAAESMLVGDPGVTHACAAFLAHDPVRAERAFATMSLQLSKLSGKGGLLEGSPEILEIAAHLPEALSRATAEQDPVLLERVTIHLACKRLGESADVPSRRVWDEVGRLVRHARTHELQSRPGWDLAVLQCLADRCGSKSPTTPTDQHYERVVEWVGTSLGRWNGRWSDGPVPDVRAWVEARCKDGSWPRLLAAIDRAARTRLLSQCPYQGRWP